MPRRKLQMTNSKFGSNAHSPFVLGQCFDIKYAAFLGPYPASGLFWHFPVDGLMQALGGNDTAGQISASQIGQRQIGFDQIGFGQQGRRQVVTRITTHLTEIFDQLGPVLLIGLCFRRAQGRQLGFQLVGRRMITIMTDARPPFGHSSVGFPVRSRHS